MIPMKLEFYGYGISRTMLACAGMGSTMGMLVGGTTFGVPTAIAAAIIGAIGGGAPRAIHRVEGLTFRLAVQAAARFWPNAALRRQIDSGARVALGKQ